MNLNPSLLVKPLIQIIVGKLIEAGNTNDKPKMVARAQEIIAINAAFTGLNTGNPAGLPALQEALTSTTALSLGEALALQSLSAGLANQIALLTNVAGSTLMGQGATLIMDSILAAGTETAQEYITKYGEPAVAGSVAAV